MKLYAWLYAWFLSESNDEDNGFVSNPVVWVVGVLAAIALLIYIVTHVDTQK